MHEPYDICIIGHVTRDRIDVRGERKTIPGGTVYYSGMALSCLGASVTVLTKASERDCEELLGGLYENGVRVVCLDSKETTVFENVYPEEDPDVRIQRVLSVADPFAVEDLGTIAARACHVGPLTSSEMNVPFLKAVRVRFDLVSLDVQGVIREARAGTFRRIDWPDKAEGLSCADIVKADRDEAEMLTGMQDMKKAAEALAVYGPKEVVITLGGEGSLILHEGGFVEVSAFHPRAIADPTGCGDTYMAGYLYQRIKGRSPVSAGGFAARIAARKMETFGPFSRERP